MSEISPKIKGILFDLDGTLVDSEIVAWKVILEVFGNRGINLRPETGRLIAGVKWKLAIEKVIEYHSPQVSRAFQENDPIRNMDVQLLHDEVMRRYREELHRNPHFVPGAVDAVQDLSKQFPLAIVSGSVRDDISWALKKLGIYDCFQFILGAEDYKKSKPDPEGYSKGIRKLSLSPAEVLVFEDSEPGIQSALSAGTWVTAISSTNHFGQKQEHAHRIIKDLTEVNSNWVNRFKP